MPVPVIAAAAAGGGAAAGGAAAGGAAAGGASAGGAAAGGASAGGAAAGGGKVAATGSQTAAKTQSVNTAAPKTASQQAPGQKDIVQTQNTKEPGTTDVDEMREYRKRIQEAQERMNENKKRKKEEDQESQHDRDTEANRQALDTAARAVGTVVPQVKAVVMARDAAAQIPIVKDVVAGAEKKVIGEYTKMQKQLPGGQKLQDKTNKTADEGKFKAASAALNSAGSGAGGGAIEGDAAAAGGAASGAEAPDIDGEDIDYTNQQAGGGSDAKEKLGGGGFGFKIFLLPIIIGTAGFFFTIVVIAAIFPNTGAVLDITEVGDPSIFPPVEEEEYEGAGGYWDEETDEWVDTGEGAPGGVDLGVLNSFDRSGLKIVRLSNGHEYTFPIAGELATQTRYTHSCKNNAPCDAADVGWSEGKIVVAITNGRVVQLNQNTTGNGSGRRATIHIMGDDGYRYFHTHLRPGSLQVTLNQRVRVGDAIGVVGDRAAADGTTPHLHIETWPRAGRDWLQVQVLPKLR